MPTWNANQYLKFVEERTRPCRDLLAGIALPRVRRVIELGCGPGNSTSILAERWPEAEITGLDSAVSMIDVARREQPQHRWMVGDISEWAGTQADGFDLVFSNAALQWVPHPRGVVSSPLRASGRRRCPRGADSRRLQCAAASAHASHRSASGTCEGVVRSRSGVLL